MPVALDARRVAGRGPIPSPVAIYGEAPGKMENYRGEAFVGKAGSVLNMNLAWHGIPRKDCFIGNVCQYWPGRGNDGKDLHPDKADLQRDEPAVMRELRLANPRVVIALGGFATEWFLPGLTDEQDLVTLNGIPHQATRKGLEHLVVIPIIHPAAGLHAPKEASWTFLGIGAAARYLANPFPVWKEAEPKTRVDLIRPKREFEITDVCAVDTEGSLAEPFCLSFNYTEATTGVILAEHAAALQFGGELIFHNGKHDIPILKKMGVGLLRPFSCWEDTMLMAANTAEHPYNLKALAYRLLNVRMNHFDRLVQPHLQEAAFLYVNEIAMAKWDAPEPYLKLDPKTKTLKECNPQPLHQRAWQTLQRFHKGTGDPLEWLADLEPGERSQVAEVCGRIPTMSNALQYVPLEEAIQYAGIDAWATRKLFPILQKELSA